jgi:signal transduction histidine kinase
MVNIGVSSPTRRAERGERESAAPATPIPSATEAVWQALQTAAGAVAHDWRSAEASVDSDVAVTTTVQQLCAAVRIAVDGEDPDIGNLPSYPSARRLFTALRSRFLDEILAFTPCPASMASALTVLRAMERVDDAIERDPSQRFGHKLSGPRAAEVLVAVAHDMRSPLASILLLVDTMRRSDSGPVSAQQARQLLLVYSAAFGLSTLTHDLMDIVRGGEGLLNASAIPFSLQECLYAVRDIVQPIAEEKKLVVEISPAKVDYRSGHPAALTRVLLNLTTNALKFTEVGSVQVAATEVSRTRVEFTVRDTGRGIPADVVETLFDAVRGRGQTGQFIFSSAGLGLSICQKLIASMGGTLQVQSAPGTGTCFSFQLDIPPVQRI